MMEKLDDCPHCGKDLGQAEYDFQFCSTCDTKPFGFEKKKILRLNLKKKWWEQIRDGKKTVELRRVTQYWRKRLVGKYYDEIHLCLGYPKAGDTSRIIKRKWRLIAKERVLHPEFGDTPVEVFVIDVAKEID